MQNGMDDPKVLGYLGRALSLELSAVQLYTTQSRLVATWGLDAEAGKFQHEALEELEHAQRIIARMLAKGVAPNASQLRPVRLGPDLLTLLQIDHEFEQQLVKLYHDAVIHCQRQRNQEDRLFFQALLDEESRHALDLANWIESLQSAD